MTWNFSDKNIACTDSQTLNNILDECYNVIMYLSILFFKAEVWMIF